MAVVSVASTNTRRPGYLTVWPPTALRHFELRPGSSNLREVDAPTRLVSGVVEIPRFDRTMACFAWPGCSSSHRWLSSLPLGANDRSA